ncbi:MAG: PilZ domain-containing protein [Myxococcota bacterium]|nr:PilZ domain-containing protein [Myxococcota bacterium]
MAKDGRRDPRQPIALEIRFKSATLADFVNRHSRDISRGGIFVKTKSPMPSGTLIKFDVSIGDNQSIIQGVGRVVWRRLEDTSEDAPAGMGIKFIKLDPTSQDNLNAILEGKPEGLAAEGEAPVLAEKSASKPPKPIAPVRPSASPREAKRTMIGLGTIPPRRKDSRPSLDKIGPGKTTPVPKPSIPLADAETGAPGENESATTESNGVTSTPESNAPQDSAVKKASDPPRETDLLADISSAIDNALDEDLAAADKEAAKPPDAADASPSTSDHSEQTAEKDNAQPGDVSVDAEKVSSPPEEQRPSTEEKKDTPSQPPGVGVISTRAGAKSKASNAPLLLGGIIVLIVGGFIGFKVFQSEDADAPPATGSQTASQAGTSPATLPPSTPEQAGLPKSKSLKDKATVPLASVEIETRPPGAMVRLDGNPLPKQTPTTIDNLQIGREIEIKTELFGYVSQSEKVVPGENPVHLDFELKPAQFSINFAGAPPGAQVLINGEKWGRIPLKLQKRTVPEAFSYEVKHLGYESTAGNVTKNQWSEEEGVFVLTLNAALTRLSASQKQGVSGLKPKPAQPQKPKPKPKATETSAELNVRNPFDEPPPTKKEIPAPEKKKPKEKTEPVTKQPSKEAAPAKEKTPEETAPAKKKTPEETAPVKKKTPEETAPVKKKPTEKAAPVKKEVPGPGKDKPTKSGIEENPF